MHTNLKKATHHFIVLALLLAVAAILFLYILSSSGHQLDASHQCIGEDCFYCKQIEDIRKITKELTQIFTVKPLVLPTLAFFVISITHLLRKAQITESPITTKVKLTD